MNYQVIKSIEELKAYIGTASVLAFDFETAPDEPYRGLPENGGLSRDFLGKRSSGGAKDVSSERRNGRCRARWDEAALDPHKSHIVGISVSVEIETGVYVPLRHRNEDANLTWDEVFPFLQSIFTSGQILKIAHNIAFETMFLMAIGILLQPPVYDTIAAAQLTLKTTDEFRNLGDSGLKTLAPQLLKTELPKFEEVTGGRHFDELDPDDSETVRYACADSDFALRLYYLFNQWFDRYLPNHRRIVEELESPVAVFSGLMKYYGVCADKQLMYQKQFDAEEKISALRQEINSLAGRELEIGANASTGQFKKYLYGELKLPVVKTTTKFQSAADMEALVLLQEWCKANQPEAVKLLEAVQELRKWNKIKSTYVDGFLNAVNTATGKIHTSFFPLGTDTGRFSSRYPNLQNLPRKTNDPVGIRNFLIPSPGHMFLDFDFSQIELRVGAWYCRDAKMLEVYQGAEGDIHAQTTAVIYEVPVKEAADKNSAGYKEHRSVAKACNFGVFYGLFPNGLMRNLKKAGIEKTKQECEEIINNPKSGYPQLSLWQEMTKQQARNCGYSETYMGRRRILKGIYSTSWSTRSYWERCALNTPIQGTAAEILKLAMVRILQGLPERPWLRPLLTIHDEILFEVPEEKIEEAAAWIRECMETQPFPDFDVPIIAEGAAGYKFGELEEIE